MATCKACGAEIVWIDTLAGKKIPCDTKLVAYWERKGAPGKVVTPNGEVLSADLMGEPDKAPGIGYVPHWATCPAADQFRRRESVTVAQIQETPDGKVSYGQSVEMMPVQSHDALPMTLSYKDCFPKATGQMIEFALPSGDAEKIQCGDLVMIDEARDAKLVLKGKAYRVVMIGESKHGDCLIRCVGVTL